jgi:DNA mismatch repair protein MSH5
MKPWNYASTLKAEVELLKVYTLYVAWLSGLKSLYTGDYLALPYIIESRPSPEFSYEAGKTKLVNLNLSTDGGPEVLFITPGYDDACETYGGANEAGLTGRQGKLLRLSAWIDMESRLSVGCAGALLTYVGRRKVVEYLPNDTAAGIFGIASVEMFSLKGMM